jgi:RND family efflux transporter MFP subunit
MRHFGIPMVRTRILTVAALASLAFAGACSRPNPGASQTARALPPLAVQASPVSRRPLERVLSVAGALFAQEQTPVSARVAGRIRSLPVDLGARVQTGELLAEMEPRDYELRVQQSRALLGQARARLGLALEGEDDQVALDDTSLVREAKAVLNQARAERERLAELSRQGIASAADLESANASYTVAQSRHADALEEARTRAAVLQQRRAEYELARKQLADTRITAPFDGIVSERRASLGQHLDVGVPLLTLVKADPLRLRVEIPERDAPRVAAGQAVRLHLTGDTNTYQGTVRRLSPSLLETSRMLVVEADVPASGALRPGAFVRAEIVVETGFPGLTVPPDALITFAGVERVFIHEDGKATERRVTTGDRGKDWIEVTSGLKGGESVIHSPAGLVNNRPVFLGTNAPASKKGT